MTTRANFSLKGFSEYLERIAATEKNINIVAAEAVDAGAQVLLEGMTERVPKDTHALEKSLAVMGPDTKGNVTSAMIGMPGKADADVARYGNVQEYGSSSMAAQPYIRPTIDSDSGKARKAMKAVLVEALQK